MTGFGWALVVPLLPVLLPHAPRSAELKANTASVVLETDASPERRNLVVRMVHLGGA